jgi:alpha-tubulin suppressor-like RCC1 family protein
VTNSSGSIETDAATLTVSAGTPSAVAPTVVTQPAAVVVNAGNTATLAVGVSGTGPFVYQWLRDGQVVTGATAAFYSIPSVAVGDSGSYSVRVSNAAGNVTSSSATLQVNASVQATAPGLTTQPSPQVQTPGGSATFAVAASGTGPISYQWQKDGASITGATSAVLVVSSINSVDAGNYTVTVYNSQGSVTSNAASLTVLGAPAITAQPTAATASEGATATFSVQASGRALGYQWMRNQVAVSGATSASYTTPALAMSDNGAVYSVVVYNGAGVAVSQSAVLTVTIAPPPPTVGLTAKAVAAGYGNSFAVDLDGTVWAWGIFVDPVTGGYKTSTPWATRPVKVQGLSGVKSITAVSKWNGAFDFENSFYALHDDGTVSAWGANRFGELGDRTTATRNLPVPVMRDAANRMTGICKIAGGSYALVMAPCAAGTVWLAGTLSTNPASVSAGFTFSAAVPTAIPGLPGTKIVKTLAMPQALASSVANSQSALLIVYDNETVLAWGDQVSNSLGAGVNADVAGSIAGPVSVWPALGSVEDARLGVGFSILQGVDFRLKAIGSDMDGRLGVGGLSDQTAPISVAVLDTVSRFSVGQADAAAIQNGQLWIWGFNNANVLRSPTRLGSESSYTEVSVGVSHGLAIGAGGVVSAWGSGTWGALGNNQPSAALPEVVVRP